MLEAFLSGCMQILQPYVAAGILVGVVLGLVVGILPGLGGVTMLALLLPFVWGAPPAVALGALVALTAVVLTGGALTSILLNIPGESANMATLLDGFPLNQKGEGARAIGAAIMASMAGGVLAVFLALGMIFVITPLVIAFKSAEIFFLIIIGLSFIAVLSGKSVTKGLIAGALGILLSLVGFQPVTGIPRFTFGLTFLYDGFHIAVFIMGFFAIPELIDMLAEGQSTISKVEAKKLAFRETLEGMKDVFRHWGVFLRSTVIGYIIGVIPGIGSATAIWIAYGQAKQTSNHPETYGTGCIEGVIAPQSADNAVIAGATLTAMAFGIPGSSSTAVLLGAFTMVGVTPGPAMLTNRLDLAFALLIGIAVANIVGGLICIGSASTLARIAFISIDFLFPIIATVVVVAAVATNEALPDLIVVVLAGVLGLVMKRFDYSRSALVLGLVLGNMFEYYFFVALRLQGPLFFLRPSTLVLIGILIALFGYRPIRARIRRRSVEFTG